MPRSTGFFKSDKGFGRHAKSFLRTNLRNDEAWKAAGAVSGNTADCIRNDS